MKQALWIVLGLGGLVLLAGVLYIAWDDLTKPRVVSGPVGIRGGVSPEDLRKGYLGISYERLSDLELSAEQVNRLGWDRAVGVTKVFAGSTAERAGLRPGDVIVALDGRAVVTPEELQSVSSEWKPDQTVELLVLRNTDDRLVEVVVRVRLMTFDETRQLADPGQ